MNDYERGFEAGFAAAVRQGVPTHPASIASGMVVGKNSKRIALTLPNELFDSILQHARETSQSMSGAICAMLEGRQLR